MARATSWSSATRLPGQACSDSRAPGEEPEACAVEVLFTDERGLSYVVFAVGPSPESAVAAAEEEARERLGCGGATDWRAA